MNNEKIQPTKLDIILEKKQNLDDTLQDCEIRIDEKLASLAEEGIISKEINPDLFETQVQDYSQSNDHFLSGVDISDDDALDQAVLNSRPFDNKGNQLAFDGDVLIEKSSGFNNLFDSDILTPEEEDEELPTVSKILGRTSSYPDDYLEELIELDASLEPEIPTHSQTNTENNPLSSKVSDLFDPASADSDKNESNESLTEHREKEPSKPQHETIPQSTDSPVLKTEKPTSAKIKSVKANKKEKPVKKQNLIGMIFPLILFVAGLVGLGAFLILSAHDFNFIDYSVLFILFTCLIFTIAMPFGASIFFMILLLSSYVALSLISVFYLEIPFEFYQIGWIVVIPLLLWSSALLVRKVRELFNFKKSLERQIASYDELEESPGLTTEKAYYKDLKYAMDRAAKGETILTLEMISISHLETLKSINGSRLWDEILYKTLKIIKMHCYNTHLIYILEGNIFSIIMENTSTKNQLLINQGITESFNSLILEYDAIDVEVELNIATIPYSREISNPFDYRALGFRHLNS